MMGLSTCPGLLGLFPVHGQLCCRLGILGGRRIGGLLETANLMVKVQLSGLPLPGLRLETEDRLLEGCGGHLKQFIMVGTKPP